MLFRAKSVYYTDKNRKRGRPGNEATEVSLVANMDLGNSLFFGEYSDTWRTWELVIQFRKTTCMATKYVRHL